MDLPTPRSAGGPRGRLGAPRLGDGSPDEDSGQVTPVLDARVEVGGGIALRGGRATDLRRRRARRQRSEEHTSELQSLMRISYAVFCLKKTKKKQPRNIN